jgi:hypothetical protein
MSLLDMARLAAFHKTNQQFRKLQGVILVQFHWIIKRVDRLDVNGSRDGPEHNISAGNFINSWFSTHAVAPDNFAPHQGQ